MLCRLSKTHLPFKYSSQLTVCNLSPTVTQQHGQTQISEGQHMREFQHQGHSSVWRDAPLDVHNQHSGH